MEKIIKYCIFKTKRGYFGVVGNDAGLLRTLLPQADREDIKRKILEAFPTARPEKRPFEAVSKAVLGYFGGKKVDFSNVKVEIDKLRPFAKKVLAACRGIGFGRVVTYRELAKKIGRPGAARAVGTVMAKNPLPLIIPCHRVIRSDGKLGGFSAPGGIKTKKKLIELESKR
jgi:O-6-methylguanine DNA methyltransferase